MDIVEYAKRLVRLNWNYQDLPPERFVAGHKEYEKMLRISWTSPEHRECWISAKKRAKK